MRASFVALSMGLKSCVYRAVKMGSQQCACQLLSGGDECPKSVKLADIVPGEIIAVNFDGTGGVCGFHVEKTSCDRALSKLCPERSKCGLCSWAHIAPAAVLQIKHNQLREAIRGSPHTLQPIIDVMLPPIGVARPGKCRTMNFAFGKDVHGVNVVGVPAPGIDAVVSPVTQCSLCPVVFHRIVEAVQLWWERNGHIPSYYRANDQERAPLRALKALWLQFNEDTQSVHASLTVVGPSQNDHALRSPSDAVHVLTALEVGFVAAVQSAVAFPITCGQLSVELVVNMMRRRLTVKKEQQSGGQQEHIGAASAAVPVAYRRLLGKESMDEGFRLAWGGRTQLRCAMMRNRRLRDTFGRYREGIELLLSMTMAMAVGGTGASAGQTSFTPRDVVVDLPCSTGLFSFAMHTVGATTVGADSMDSHVDVARRTQIEHQYPRCHFCAATKLHATITSLGVRDHGNSSNADDATPHVELVVFHPSRPNFDKANPAAMPTSLADTTAALRHALRFVLSRYRPPRVMMVLQDLSELESFLSEINSGVPAQFYEVHSAVAVDDDPCTESFAAIVELRRRSAAIMETGAKN